MKFELSEENLARIFHELECESIRCRKYNEEMNFEVALGTCKCSEATRRGWLPICQWRNDDLNF